MFRLDSWLCRIFLQLTCRIDFYVALRRFMASAGRSAVRLAGECLNGLPGECCEQSIGSVACVRFFVSGKAFEKYAMPE